MSNIPVPLIDMRGIYNTTNILKKKEQTIPSIGINHEKKINIPLNTLLNPMMDDTETIVPDPFIKYNNMYYKSNIHGSSSVPFRPDVNFRRNSSVDFTDNFSNIKKQSFNNNNEYTPWDMKNSPFSPRFDTNFNYQNYLSRSPLLNLPVNQNTISGNRYMPQNYNLLNNQAMNNQAMNDQTINNRAMNNQAMNNQAMNNQAMNNRAMNNQAMNNQAMNNQAMNNQTMNNQAINNQAMNNQAINNQAMNNQAMNNQTINNQAINNQTMNNQTSEKGELEQRKSEPTEEDKIKEQRLRGDYAAKYARLKLNFPHIEVVGPKEEWSVEQIVARFEGYEKVIKAEASVQNNQMFLVILWVIIQVVGTRWCGLPLTGYVQFQGTLIKKYHELLYKLPEDKNISNVTESWSIPTQIVWLSISSCILFTCSKLALNYLGKGAGDMVTGALKELFDGFSGGSGMLKAESINSKLKEVNEATKDIPEPLLPNAKKPGYMDMLGNVMDMFSSDGKSNNANGMSGIPGMMNMFSNLMGMFGNNGGGADEEEEPPKKREYKGFAQRRKMNREKGDKKGSGSED